jgi:hypothetical protein
MSQVSHVEPAAPARPPRERKDSGIPQDDAERFSPLLTREEYTFSRMRTDKRGPRMFSTLCSPGWKQS